MANDNIPFFLETVRQQQYFVLSLAQLSPSLSSLIVLLKISVLGCQINIVSEMQNLYWIPLQRVLFSTTSFYFKDLVINVFFFVPGALYSCHYNLHYVLFILPVFWALRGKVLTKNRSHLSVPGILWSWRPVYNISSSIEKHCNWNLFWDEVEV